MKNPLILLHGALADRNQFNRLIPLLDPHFSIHTLDFDGHGFTPVTNKGFNMTVFADNIINYMDDHDIDKAQLFGYSMGGYAGLAACFIAPDRVEKLSVLGTKLFWTEDGARQEVRMLDAEKIREKVPKFAAVLEKTHRATGWEELLEITAEMMISMGKNPPLTEKALATIQHDILLGVGDRDTTAGVEDTLRAFRILPNAQFKVYPNTPHPFEKVTLNELAEALVAFHTVDLPVTKV